MYIKEYQILCIVINNDKYQDWRVLYFYLAFGVGYVFTTSKDEGASTTSIYSLLTHLYIFIIQPYQRYKYIY